MITKIFLIPCLVVLLPFFLLSCGGGGGDGGREGTQAQTSYVVSGVVQKGPFIRGSSIIIQELRSDLSPTGLTFLASTSDDFGKFEVPLPLSSPFIEVTATGYYFDEIAGTLSQGQITLKALADISPGGNIRINVLTHLAAPRIKHLVSTGKALTAAKNQAELEVLRVLGLPTTTVGFEHLDLSSPGTGNGILLAASAILQEMARNNAANASTVTAELSQSLAIITTDIATTGTLQNTTYSTRLTNAYGSFNTPKVRQNLATYYTNLGVPVQIPSLSGIINRAPIANAGQFQQKPLGSTATLDGSASYDLDGDPLTHKWTILSRPAGSQAPFTDSNSVSPNLFVDVSGTYVIQLIVNDGQVDSLPVVVQVSTLNAVPQIVLSGPSLVFVGAQATFDASTSSDADKDPLSFSWTLSEWKYGGSISWLDPYDWFDVILSGTRWQSQSQTASFIFEHAGAYRFTIRVSDGRGGDATAYMYVTAVTPLSDNGNGTVTDTYTGRMWQKQDDGNRYNLAEAKGVPVVGTSILNPNNLNVCGDLRLAGYTDWRVPEIEELESLVDMTGGAVKINLQYFPTTKGERYISNRFVPNVRVAGVDFSNGETTYVGGAYVRCVRP